MQMVGVDLLRNAKLVAPFLLLILIPSGGALTGGPDAHGYTFEDSSEGLVTYTPVDVAGLPVGMAVNLAPDSGLAVGDMDDGLYGAGLSGIGIPGLYTGNEMLRLWASTNGFISTMPANDDATDPDPTNECPDIGPAPNGHPRAMLFHDDLVVEGGIWVTLYGMGILGGDVHPFPHPDGIDAGVLLLTHYDDVRLASGGGTWDMWLGQWANGDFIFQYGPGMPAHHSATIGIQNADGSDSLIVSCVLGVEPIERAASTAGTCVLPDEADFQRQFRGGARSFCELFPAQKKALAEPGTVALVTADAGCRAVVDLDPGRGRDIRNLREGRVIPAGADVWAVCGPRGGTVAVELEGVASGGLSESAILFRAPSG